MNIRIYYEPVKRFESRLENLEFVTLSQLVRVIDSKSSEILCIELLSSKSVFVISLADCSRVNAHFLENFNYVLNLLEESGVIDVYINNPPLFFKNQLLNTNENITLEKFEYKKIQEADIKKVKKNFNTEIIGQTHAKKVIIRKLVSLMIRPNNKPLVLMFYGNPGIGKTETAKYLSSVLYGTDSILREQMTMVGGESSVKYFKSTSHNEDSFSKKLLSRNSNVILLDEFVLAPPFFQTSFFQMFDEGHYSDQNFEVDVSNSIIICTSNCLSKKDLEQNVDSALLSRFDAFIKFIDFTIPEKQEIVNNIYDKILNGEDSIKDEYKSILDKNEILEKVYLELPELINVRNIRRYIEDCISDDLYNKIIE